VGHCTQGTATPLQLHELGQVSYHFAGGAIARAIRIWPDQGGAQWGWPDLSQQFTECVKAGRLLCGSKSVMVALVAQLHTKQGRLCIT